MNCEVCAQPSGKIVLQPERTYDLSKDYAITQCEKCGLGATSPKPSPSELNEIYSRSYGYEAFDLIAEEKLWRSRKLCQKVGVSEKVVLDIGCMYGFLLDEALKLGATQTIGLELDANAAKIATSKGHQVFNQALEEFSAGKTNTFDVIFMQHSLEHFLEPHKTLGLIRNILKPRGKLVICVPNFASSTRKFFKKYWGWLLVPVHIFHFTENSLSTLLESSSLKVTKKYSNGADSLMILSTLAQTAGMKPHSRKMGNLSLLVTKLFSVLFRWYFFVGAEELVLIAEKAP